MPRQVRRYEHPAALERATRAECERRFSERWGSPFIRSPGSTAPDGVRLVAAFLEGEEANKRTEDEARVVYNRLRERFAEAAEFVSTNPAGAGGVAAAALYALVHQFGGGLPTVGEVEEQYPELAAISSRRTGRGALVEAFGRGYLLDGRELTDEELAVLSILCGLGPSITYADLLLKARDATPAAVIHYEAKSIRSVRSTT